MPSWFGGNRLASYYMGLKKKHNWRNVDVLLSTPLPNPSGITGVMLCYVTLFFDASLVKGNKGSWVRFPVRTKCYYV